MNPLRLIVAILLALVPLANGQLGAAEEAGDAPKNREASDSPETAFRSFGDALATKNLPALKSCCVPNPDLELLVDGEQSTPEQLAQAREFFQTVPLTRLMVGDKINLPSGKEFTVDKSHVNSDRVEFKYGDSPVPAVLVKYRDRWRVEAGSFVAARLAARKLLREADAKAGKSKEIPRWSLDAEQTEKLAVRTTVDAFEFKPPAGWQRTKGVVWQSPPRDDGASASLGVITGQLEDSQKSATPEAILAPTMSQIAARRRFWLQGAPQQGQVGALTVTRIRWCGVIESVKKELNNRPAQGFVCLAIHGKNFVVILASDVEPNCNETLSVCESVVASLTVRGVK